MEYKWYDIRKKIIAACNKTFIEQRVSMSVSDIEKSTDLFDRIVSYPLQYHAVANLQVDMQQSLQGAFVDHVGITTDLRNVLNLMDAYLKKVLIMAGIKNQLEIEQGQPSLKPLLQYTNASSSFSRISVHINESVAASFNQDTTGAYIFCMCYLARNGVHESREMDAEDVYKQLRYAVAAYILVTHHLSSSLFSHYPTLNTPTTIDLAEINETGYVYDFINYGYSSHKIKNRIVESFILNQVYKNRAAISVKSLVKEVQVFSKQSLSEGSIMSIIGRMIPSKLHYLSTNKSEVYLNEDECDRIKKALEDYTLLVARLVADIESILNYYMIFDKTQSVYNQLKLFFEENCLSIIQIMDEQDGEASNERSEAYIESFKVFLRDVGCPEEHLDELFKRLLKACALNDVLVRIALGKKFTNVTNPDSFTSGLGHREKTAYLDTQLLLYALCDFVDFIPYSESPSFLIVKSLVNLSKQNRNIKLATITPYVNEAAYHLKRAVQLIPFDDLYKNKRIKLSDNVFYSYYYYLKDNELLNEGVESFAAFLNDLFGVTYDDLLNGSFEIRNSSYLRTLLEQDYGIAVEDTPFFPETDVVNSETVFTTALMEKGDNRSPIAAKKDSIMGLYLFSASHQSASEPFFLSWDKAFYLYKKEYIARFQRSGVSSWHLFNPAKFVNHLNLLDLRVDVDVMTEDLISIIEDSDTAANTKRVLDSIRKLLERSNVNSRQKRKLYSEIIFNETEFPDDTSIPEESKLRLTNEFATAFDRLLTLMQSGDHKWSEFSKIISDADRFKEIVTTMRRRLSSDSIDACVSSMFGELEKVVKLKEDNDSDSKLG